MADRKITDLTALAAGSQATGDLLTIVDVSESAAADKNKNITVESLFQGIPGQVVIGGTAPLDSDKQLTLTTTTTSGGLGILSPNNGRGDIFFGDAADDNVGQIKYSHVNDSLTIRTNAADRFTIDSSGNVGIGKISSGNKLEIEGQGDTKVVIDGRTDAANGSDAILELWSKNSGGTNNFGFIDYDGDGNFEIGSGGSGAGSVPLVFKTNATERMRIDNSGRLLIGTSTARANLVVGLGSNTVPAAGAATASALFSNATGGGAYGLIAGATSSGHGYLQAQRADGTASTYDLYIQPNGGNVGIGTTSPGVRLDVDVTNSALRVKSDTSAAQILITSDDNASAKIEFGDESDNDRGAITYDNPNNALIFQANASERMRIDSSGRVLIGATAAANATTFLTVQNGSGDAQITLNSGPTSESVINMGDTGDFNIGAIRYSQTDNAFRFFTSNAERVRIDSSGRLLVGTSSSYGVGSAAQAKFQASDTTSNIHASFTDWSTANSGGIIVLGKAKGGSAGNYTIVANGDILGSIRFAGADGTDLQTNGALIRAEVDGTPGSNDMPGRLVFSTTADGSASPSARMIINRHGECRIGHGDSDPVSGDRAHSIGDPKLDTVTSNLARLVMQERSSNWISFKDGGGTHYGTISRNGSGVSYGSNSDYRLKNNVQNFTGGIALVKQLRPVTFNWNELSGNPDTTSTQRGFLAHEVQAVEPTAVTGNKDEMDRYGDCYDAEGRKTQTNVFEHQAKEGETWTFQSEHVRDQQLDPAKLVPILTAALQEAIAEIETLKTKVAALEAG